MVEAEATGVGSAAHCTADTAPVTTALQPRSAAWSSWQF